MFKNPYRKIDSYACIYDMTPKPENVARAIVKPPAARDRESSKAPTVASKLYVRLIDAGRRAQGAGRTTIEGRETGDGLGGR
jgi:hypothetical protein